MKLFVFTAILASLCKEHFVTSNHVKSASKLSRAFKDISKTFYNLNREGSTINYSTDLETINAVVHRNSDDDVLPSKIKNIKLELDKQNYDLDDSAILSFDSFQSLSRFNEIVNLTNIFPKMFLFYVYCRDASIKDITSLKDADNLKRHGAFDLFFGRALMTNILQYQYFIVNEENGFRLMTFVWQAPGKCEPQLVEVNRFNSSTNKWMHARHVLQTFDNFHGCKLVFGAPLQLPSSAFWIRGGKVVRYEGFNLYALETLADTMNYSFELNPFLSVSEGYFFKTLEVDLLVYIGDFRFYHTKLNKFVTQPYVFENNYFAVPSPETYTSFEKLFLPFDTFTWVLIIITFVAAYSTVLVINFTKAEIRNFVFGRNVTTPSLNIAAHFFGISQIVLPRRNFARYLTMLFIIYSLIIRTAWQGKMFEFMNKNMSKPEIQSIDEMIEKNLTVYMKNHVYEANKEMDFMKK